jgi:hypothetical protein
MTDDEIAAFRARAVACDEMPSLDAYRALVADLLDAAEQRPYYATVMRRLREHFAGRGPTQTWEWAADEVDDED